jgi:hypothetical protein
LRQRRRKAYAVEGQAIVPWIPSADAGDLIELPAMRIGSGQQLIVGRTTIPHNDTARLIAHHFGLEGSAGAEKKQNQAHGGSHQAFNLTRLSRAHAKAVVILP